MSMVDNAEQADSKTEQGTDQQTETKQGSKPVLSESNQIELYKARDRYIKRAKRKGSNRTELEKYLHQDFKIVKPTHYKKAESITKAVLYEYHSYRDQIMQNLYSEIKQVLAGTEKWTINTEGELTTIYPKPVVSGDRVRDITYTEDRAYYYPPELWEWMMEQEELEHYREINRTRRSSIKRIDNEQVRLWLYYMDERGYSRKQLADLFLVSNALMARRIKKYKQEQDKQDEQTLKTKQAD
ncbi:hypothetical protein K6L05_03665 [Salinicoccus roseus]|uniref:hypothetical protein n=1 Tax=Salinicoccus roseus TaxID=45670 RepID=UPI001CA73A53|nr:hypothetical protein [Salinicoccus roseus]MBY8908882.1 hypothetical protein [Salinicoccus roseus]